MLFRWVFPTLRSIYQCLDHDCAMPKDPTPNMAPSVTGVILAGGRSSRFSGRNKALLRVGSERILDRIFRVFRPIFSKIVLVTNDPSLYLAWDVKIVADLYDVRSSLIGIHAGLFHAETSHAFFSACDTPFLAPGLVAEIVSRIRPETDVVVPKISAGYEPLCAVYARRCLSPIENQLRQGRLKIQEFFSKVRVETVSEEDVRRFDEKGASFININTAKDLADAEAVLPSIETPGRRGGQRKNNVF